MMSDNFRAQRPTRAEYDEYYHTYIGKVPDGDIIEILGQQLDQSLALFASIPEEKETFRYAPGKWSTKEVIGHIIDTEWIFVYRALRFARGDTTPLVGMDQDTFMDGARFNSRPMRSIVDEYRHLRSADLALFESFGEDILERTGSASGFDFTVRAILYLVAGHERHHIGVLKERYLGV